MPESFDLHAAAFAAVHRWWRAWVDHDTGVVEQMASVDYVERDDMGRLNALGSGGLIEIMSCQGEACGITEWELTDPITRLYESVVVCSYAFRFSGSRGAHVVEYRGRATDVLQRNGERWVLVSHEGVLDRGRRVG